MQPDQIHLGTQSWRLILDPDEGGDPIIHIYLIRTSVTHDLGTAPIGFKRKRERERETLAVTWLE